MIFRSWRVKKCICIREVYQKRRNLITTKKYDLEALACNLMLLPLPLLQLLLNYDYYFFLSVYYSANRGEVSVVGSVGFIAAIYHLAFIFFCFDQRVLLFFSALVCLVFIFTMNLCCFSPIWLFSLRIYLCFGKLCCLFCICYV